MVTNYQDWNKILRLSQNPFRIRVTSQSPFISLRGPFSDGSRTKSAGIRLTEPDALKRAYELAEELKANPGALERKQIPGSSRFSGWKMLVTETRRLLERLPLKSVSAYSGHLNALAARTGDPSGASVLAWIGEQKPERRDYICRCDTAVKLIEAGLDDLSRDDVLKARLRNKYNSNSVAERVLPSDKEIEEWIDSLESAPQWQWVFGVIAAYGLRPHEAFRLDTGPDEDHLVEVGKNSKTGYRCCHAVPEEWVTRWQLQKVRLPAINLERGNRVIGETISKKCRRLRSAAIGTGSELTPYDLRHCWARRIHTDPECLSKWTPAQAAESMGHSEAIHRRAYLRWITKKEQRQRAQAMRQERQQ